MCTLALQHLQVKLAAEEQRRAGEGPLKRELAIVFLNVAGPDLFACEVERHQLTAGTTWHAAGLMVTYGSTSETSTELRKYSRDLYGRLEAETGQATGFMPIGFIEVAADGDRLQEFRRVAAVNRYCGIDVQEISPREVQQLFPLAKVDDIAAGFYVKEDGRVNPVDVTMALGKGARMRGVRILEGVPATGVLQKNGRVSGVSTPFGDIQTEYVVNCAGMWAREVGAMSGVAISNQAAGVNSPCGLTG